MPLAFAIAACRQHIDLPSGHRMHTHIKKPNQIAVSSVQPDKHAQYTVGLEFRHTHPTCLPEYV